MPSMKFVQTLDDATREHLRQIMRESTNTRQRQRAHAVLLSDKRYKIDQIADIFFVDRDTVSRWLDDWQSDQVDGLTDAPRSGRPPKLDKEQQDEAVHFVLEEPRQIKRGVARIAEHFEQAVSLDWVRRLLHKRGYRYKRMRLSLRRKRDQAAFLHAQAELALLQAREDHGAIDLYYFDESGFALRPSVPYAWQQVGERLAIEQTGGRALNVLGFIKRDLCFTPYVTESSVTSETVIACLNHFAQGLSRETIVVLDNAPAHTSGAFQAMLPRWKEKGLAFYFLPSYSPELNLIEHVWKQMKYYWMPPTAYLSWQALGAALDELLVGIGTKYRITFA